MKTAALLGLVLGLVLAAEFNPEKHLPGYTEAYWGQDAGFYDFTPFEEKNGKRITDQELQLLLSLWEREKQAAEERRKAPPDPTKQFLGQLDERLQSDRFFRRHKFERLQDQGDLLLLVQLPANPPNLYVQGIEREYRGHVQAVEEHFRKQFVLPLGLQRGARVPVTVLVVLASRGNYDDYGQAQRHGYTLQVSVAHYDPRHRLSITFEDGSALARRVSDEKMRTVCHEIVHALTDAYSTTGIQTMPLWLIEGLAEYVSTFRGFVRSGSIEFARLSRDDLRTCTAILHREETRQVFPGIQDLFRVKSIFGLVPIVAERLGGNLSDRQTAVAAGMLYPASSMLVYYLQEGAPEDRRRRFQGFLNGAFRGKSSYEDFMQALDIQNAAVFDREFQEYVLKLAGDELGAEVPELPPIPADLRLPEIAGATPVAFILAPPTAEEQVGCALALAAAGRFADALALAREAQASPDVISFLGSFKQYSDSVLQAARVKNANIVFGPGLARRVVRFDDTVIDVTDWKKNESRIERTLFGPKKTVEYARKLSMSDPLLDASIALLAGNDELAAAVKDLDAQGAETLAARRQAWPALLLAGQVRERLERLRDAIPADPADPAPLLEDIAFLLGAGAKCEAAQRMREKLITAARRLLAQQFEQEGLAFASFAVKPVPAADGGHEFRYAFREMDDMLDFDVEWSPPARLQSILAVPTLPGSWQITSDGLRGTGSVNLVHKARFLAPVTIEVTSSVGIVSSQAFRRQVVALALDSQGSYAALLDDDHLEFLDAAKRKNGHQQAKVTMEMVIDTMRVLTLRHDGALLSADLDGRRVVDLPLGEMPAGRIALAQRGTMQWNIRSLVLRGKLAPGFAAEAMESWIAQRLREMGG